MNKKLRLLVISIAFICMEANIPAINVSAIENTEIKSDESQNSEDDSKIESGIKYKIKDDSTIEIVQYVGDDSKVDIPETIEGKIVTSIGNGAFNTYESISKELLIPPGSDYDVPKSNVTSITIPDTVTSIGDAAFANCVNLKSVKLPTNIKKINDYTFNMCSSLEEINLNDSIEYIGKEAFCNCENLKCNISLEKAQYIGPSAFKKCYNIEKVTLSNELKDIKENTFEYCSSLTSINIPENTETIGAAAFLGCKNLSEISFNDSLKSIAYSAFTECKTLKEINIPKNIKAIDETAFSNCSNLENITVDEDNEYFCSCKGSLYNKDKTALIKFADKLSSIDIPDTVTDIDNGAFSYCHNLQQIYIPDNVSDLHSGYFRGCTSLSEIKVSEKNKNYSSFDGALYDKNQNKLIRVPIQKNQINLPESVTDINASYSFSDCDNLESINVDNKNPNYNSIDGVVFNKANTDITFIPKKIKVINLPETFEGDFVLSNTSTDFSLNDCYALEAINVDKNNKEYSSINGVLYNKNFDKLIKAPSTLNTIKIKDTVKEIGDSAFKKCTNLKCIKIPDSTEVIGYEAFYNCDKLEAVYIPSSVKKLSDNFGCIIFSPFERGSSVTIYGEKDSFAEKYANEMKISFKPSSEYNYKEPDDIKSTETPKTPEDIKATETPKTPQDVKPTETPKTPEDIKPTETPKSPDDKKGTETPKETTTESPKVSEGNNGSEEDKSKKTSDKASIMIIFTMIGSLIGGLKLKKENKI